MTIDFYNSPGSGPCRAVSLVAKLLGLELNSKILHIRDKDHLTPEFIKINPQHCIPTLVDNGFVLWESHVILTYLVQKYGKDDSLYPRDPKKRAVVDQRLYFDVGTLNARFADYYYPILRSNKTPDPEKFKKMEEAFQFLETFLEGQEYVAGNTLTVADVSLVATVATYDAATFDVSSYKNITRWYNKVKSSIPDYEAINGKDFLTTLFGRHLKK